MSLILNGTDGLSDVDGTAATPAIRGTDANTGIFFPAADTIAFSEGGAESMRIDSSGNVGIGRTPDQRLQIAAPTAVEYDMFVGSTRTLTLYADATQTIIANPTAVPMIFRTSDTERMRITSDGTLRQTLNPVLFNIDASPCTATVTNGSNINFGSYSGGIFATDTSSSGETALLLCGGGSTFTFGSSQFTNTSGSGNYRFYNSGAGYVLQNNSGGTITFGLFVVRTRAGT